MTNGQPPTREEIIASLTDDEVRAWAKRRLRQLGETHGVRIAALTLMTTRSVGRGDYPEDDFDSISVHACGKCEGTEPARRGEDFDAIARRLKATLIGDPAGKARQKREEAARLLRQADELSALAAQVA